jgi:acyl-CoA reductase-like NAD-dependent aldehyde dehydrogenase
VAVATGSEHGLFINAQEETFGPVVIPFEAEKDATRIANDVKQSGFGRELWVDTLDLYLETKGVLVSTSPKPFNPFGL